MVAKTAIGYERKPPQCVQHCPFDDAHAAHAGVQLNPNCKGPSRIDSVDPPVIGTLDTDGISATYDPTTCRTPKLGTFACRGAWEWVREQQNNALSQ